MFLSYQVWRIAIKCISQFSGLTQKIHGSKLNKTFTKRRKLANSEILAKGYLRKSLNKKLNIYCGHLSLTNKKFIKSSNMPILKFTCNLWNQLKKIHQSNLPSQRIAETLLITYYQTSKNVYIQLLIVTVTGLISNIQTKSNKIRVVSKSSR